MFDKTEEVIGRLQRCQMYLRSLGRIQKAVDKLSKGDRLDQGTQNELVDNILSLINECTTAITILFNNEANTEEYKIWIKLLDHLNEYMIYMDDQFNFKLVRYIPLIEFMEQEIQIVKCIRDRIPMRDFIKKELAKV